MCSDFARPPKRGRFRISGNENKPSPAAAPDCPAAEPLETIVGRHGLTRWTTDLDTALADGGFPLYFDAQLTSVREKSIGRALDAGKHIYTEKPLAESVDGALTLARQAAAAGVKNGVVHDKLYLPGLRKLARLVDSGFFGRILSVRGEFGYWVFEGDWQSAQRPSRNYRAEDGGGIVVDMFCLTTRQPTTPRTRSSNSTAGSWCS